MNRILVILFFTVLLVRGAIGFASLASLQDDPDAYRAIATCLRQTAVYGLVDGEGQPHATAFRPPLYPLVLAALSPGGTVSSSMVVILHSILAAITVLLTYAATRSLINNVKDRVTPIVAATLVSIDPILIQQSRLVMTETLATMLVAVVLWWVGREAQIREDESQRVNRIDPKSAMILGGIMGLAFLCRPTFFVWAILLIVGYGKFAARQSIPTSLPFRFAWQTAGAIALTFVIPIAAWTFRNAARVGDPIWATSHGGYTLLLANNPKFYDYLREGSWGEIWQTDSFFDAYAHRFQGDVREAQFWEKDWSGVPVVLPNEEAMITEGDDDRLAYEGAKATIKRHPGTFIYSCLVRVGRLWAPLPHFTPGRSQIVGSLAGLYYVVLFAAVLVGVKQMWYRRRHPVMWSSLALVLALTAVHSLYWTNARMRAPATPCLAIFAAVAVAGRRVNGEAGKRVYG